MNFYQNAEAFRRRLISCAMITAKNCCTPTNLKSFCDSNDNVFLLYLMAKWTSKTAVVFNCNNSLGDRNNRFPEGQQAGQIWSSVGTNLDKICVWLKSILNWHLHLLSQNFCGDGGTYGSFCINNKHEKIKDNKFQNGALNNFSEVFFLNLKLLQIITYNSSFWRPLHIDTKLADIKNNPQIILK